MQDAPVLQGLMLLEPAASARFSHAGLPVQYMPAGRSSLAWFTKTRAITGHAVLEGKPRIA